jgi:hypothetical protein
MMMVSQIQGLRCIILPSNFARNLSTFEDIFDFIRFYSITYSEIAQFDTTQTFRAKISAAITPHFLVPMTETQTIQSTFVGGTPIQSATHPIFVAKIARLIIISS